MRVYFDVCCLNRPFDDLSQERVRRESEAVKLSLTEISAGRHHWVSSAAVDHEVGRCADEARRLAMMVTIELSAEQVDLTEDVLKLGESLEAAGIRGIDAIHVALAEQARCDVFLTTDARLLKKAARLTKIVRVRVLNPIEWVREVSP